MGRVCLHTLTGFRGQPATRSLQVIRMNQNGFRLVCLKNANTFDIPKSSTEGRGLASLLGRLPKHLPPAGPTLYPRPAGGSSGSFDSEAGCDGCCVPNSGVGRKKLERNWFLLAYKNECSTQGSQNGWDSVLKTKIAFREDPTSLCHLQKNPNWMYRAWNVTQLTSGFNLGTGGLLPHTAVFLVTS